MIFTLIALVLMLLAGAALFHTLDASQGVVNNLAFRRDLTNRADEAVVEAKASFAASAPLGTTAALEKDESSAHYYASRQASGQDGVPAILLSASDYDTRFGTPAGTDASQGVTLRWVIDRQCVAAGAFDAGSCEHTNVGGDKQGTTWPPKPGGTERPIYRISVRATGPRGTEAFFQTTYAN